MYMLFKKIIESIQVRLRKQRYRKTLRISYELYIDTFNISEGNVRLYGTIAGQTEWSISVELEYLLNLLKKSEDLFQYKIDAANIDFRRGVFYIRRQSESIMFRVVFDRAFGRGESLPIKMDRDDVSETLETLIALRESVRSAE